MKDDKLLVYKVYLSSTKEPMAFIDEPLSDSFDIELDFAIEKGLFISYQELSQKCGKQLLI